MVHRYISSLPGGMLASPGVVAEVRLHIAGSPHSAFRAPVAGSRRLAGMASFGLFRGWWKYAGISDGIDIIKAVGTGSVLFLLATRYLFVGESLPRAVYVLEAMLTTGLLAGVRLLTRVLAGSMLQMSRLVSE